MTSPVISVVVCTYNRAHLLRLALESVLAQETAGLPIELVIVDDGSTDDTSAVADDVTSRATFPVVYARQARQGGIANARNVGIARSTGTYVAFFDDDQLADANWLSDLHQVAVDKQAELVGGPRYLDLPEEQLRALGPVCRSLLGENLYHGTPSALTGKELPTTGNLLLSRTLVDRVGPFDTNLSSGSDADFIGRARNSGVTVWTAPKALVAHMIPPYRATMSYFKWVSQRWGVARAAIDHKRVGLLGTVINASLRMAQSLLLHLPRLLLARLKNDNPSASDLRCLIWRTEGYTRRALQRLAPALFPQHRYFDSLDFRRERELFPRTGAA